MRISDWSSDVCSSDLGEGGSTLDAIGKIVVQLLLPFIAGQIARRWIGDWVARNKGWLKNVDQSSILLVVYTAFSHAVVEGIWQQEIGRASCRERVCQYV